MSLRTKLALALFVTVALFLTTDHALRRVSFFASFASLEQSRAEAEIDRTRNALEELAEGLTRHAEELAGGAPRGDEAAASAVEFEARIVVDESGTVHEHRVVHRSTGAALRIREFPSDRLSSGHPLLLAWRAGGAPTGLVLTRSGLMFVGSAELVVDGRPALLMLGRLLDPSLTEDLHAAADSRFEIAAIDTPTLDVGERAAFEQAAAFGGVRIDESRDGRTVAFTVLHDVRGLPVALLRTPVAGGELALWNQLERYEVLTSLALILLLPLILLILIQWMVVGPVSRLTSHATEIERSDDASMRLGLERRDEIGRLAREFDHMLEKLETSRIEQQRTARFAGRSEVAVGVMHNVGNLANSLGVSAGLVRDRFDRLDAGDLRKVFDELVAHEGELDRYLSSDPRGRHLMQFLGAIVERMEEDFERAREESDAVVDDVRRISELVQDLEDSKAPREVVEPVDLSREIEAALRLALSSTGIDVEVVRDIREVPVFVTDRQRVLETLVAVTTNALEAMESTPINERFLAISLDQPSTDRARIEVRDFGVGIERHQLSRIFAAGITTKTGGSGFGLHLASLAAAELGGAISVASDGPGTGATFTLELPIADARAASAAEAA